LKLWTKLEPLGEGGGYFLWKHLLPQKRKTGVFHVCGSRNIC
jgi:hypothetical protein